MIVQQIDNGLLVRIGNREGAQQKGRRYVLEGRVCIRYCGPQGVRAFVRGQGALYHVRYVPDLGWSCTCPAKGRCAHLVGVQLVVAPMGNSERVTTLGGPDE